MIINTWNDFPRENVCDVDAMPAQALQAYFVLKNQSCLDSEIVLMVYHSNDSLIDLDGDNADDSGKAMIDYENQSVNKDNLKNAIDELCENSTPFDEVIFYVVAHSEITNGGPAFSFENRQTVTSIQFSEWIDCLVCKRMVILLDFCFSGDFAESLIKSGRIVISAAEDKRIAWYYWDWDLNETEKRIFGRSGSAFFHPFWKKLDEGMTIQQAFMYGKEQCVRWGSIDTNSQNITQIQNPQIHYLDRNLLEEFVLFYPGGFSVFLTATTLLVLTEAVAILVKSYYANTTV